MKNITTCPFASKSKKQYGAYSELPNKRRRRLLIFVFFSRVDDLIPVSTIIEFHRDKFQTSITFQQK